ncbi:MAG: hypothetical protein LBT62_06675 [Deltaproteobacteria bacterium]|jgi:hypothetical protein|nr:hypothetical protein [Deltaproteobacteria bacterium]
MFPLNYRVMDPQIFNLRLNVNTTSAYIVLCSLQEDGVSPSRQAVEDRWLGQPDDLRAAFNELLAWRIIEIRSDKDGNDVYIVNPASLWSAPQID